MSWSVLKKSFNSVTGNPRKHSKRTKSKHWKQKLDLDESYISDDSEENEIKDIPSLQTPQTKKQKLNSEKSYATLNISKILTRKSLPESQMPDELIDLCSGHSIDYNISHSQLPDPPPSTHPATKPLQLLNANATSPEKSFHCSFRESQNTGTTHKWVSLSPAFDKSLQRKPTNASHKPFQKNKCELKNEELYIEDDESLSNSSPRKSPRTVQRTLLFGNQTQDSTQIQCSNSSTHSQRNLHEIINDSSTEIVQDGNTELELLINLINNDIKKEKKIRPKKGGYVEKLRKILSSNQSANNFWRTEIETGIINEPKLHSITNIIKSYENHILTMNVANETFVIVTHSDHKSENLQLGQNLMLQTDFQPYKIDKTFYYVSVKMLKHLEY